MNEPARSLRERRLKRFAMKDVAGMLRSFDYAAHAALIDLAPDDLALRAWAQAWVDAVTDAFFRQYLETASGGAFLPSDRGEIELLLSTFLLEKGLYELRYELNSRPTWVRIPLRGLLELARGLA